MYFFLANALIVVLVFSSSSYTITVSTDKSSYTRGALVSVSGRLTEAGSAVSGVYVGCQVNKPDNSTLWTDQLKTDSNGYYAGYFTLPSNSPYGTYTVYATYGGTQATTTFTVVTGVPEFPTEIVQAVTVLALVLTLHRIGGHRSGSALEKLMTEGR